MGARVFAAVVAAAAVGLIAGCSPKPATHDVASGSAPAAATMAASCDRTCLVGVMRQYLNSLPTHSAAGLPLADKVKFTEQAAQIPIGDGLWVSATEAPTDFQIYAADPKSGQVGFFGVMKQWGKPILLSARLKVEGGKITEIENIIASDLRPAGLANLHTPRPALLDDVPANLRTPRAQMLSIADSYFDSIEQDNGNIAPYADDCVRHENGMQTTSNKGPAKPGPLDQANPGVAAAFAKLSALGCRDSMNSHVLQYITMIRPRHLLIVDEQKGLVYGFPRFVHRGNVRVEKIVGVPGVDTIPMNFGPNDLQAGELFKIWGGQIHEIEAMGFINAYMNPTGWDAEYPETYKYAVTHPNTHPYQAGANFPAK